MVTVHNSRYHTVGWSGKLTDAPVTVKNYGTAQFRPVAIWINYCKRDGRWRALKAEISGPLLKSDGTDGKNDISSWYYLDLGSLDAPEWLLDIVAVHTPMVVQ